MRPWVLGRLSFPGDPLLSYNAAASHRRRSIYMERSLCREGRADREISLDETLGSFPRGCGK